MPNNLLYYLLAVALASCLMPHFVRCQEPILASLSQDVKGNAKLILYDREYTVFKGRYIGSLPVKIDRTELGKDGGPALNIEYGTGEKHTTYSRRDGLPVIQISYFGPDGKPVDNESPFFEPNANSVSEVGLCPNFRVRRDDKLAQVEREYEICLDGTERAKTVREFGVNHEIVREIRTDKKMRSWESMFGYDQDGNVIEFRYIVDDTKKPKYTQTVRYNDYRFDNKGNWIRVTVVSFFSGNPDRIAYQFYEKRTISYVEK